MMPPNRSRSEVFDAGDSPGGEVDSACETLGRETLARENVEHMMEERLGRMPREIGVLLLTIGVVGVVLPGIVGTPALLAGGLVLWPRGFRGINGWLRRRCPKVHAKGMEQLLRYLDDMERRYPSRSSRTSPAAPEEPQP